MKRVTFGILLFVIVFLSGGCASSYHTIIPERLNYTSSGGASQKVELGYRYSVLGEQGNRKYAKREVRYNIKLVAVRITNHSDEVINMGRNVAFYSGDKLLYPMDALAVRSYLRQSPASYLFYLLLTPLTLTVGESDPFPLGLIMGPALSLGNLMVANNANNNLFYEMNRYNVIDRDIQPDETVYGLVAFREIGFEALSVKYIE